MLSLASLACLATVAGAQDADCLHCHGDLAKEKVVHAALQMGCKTCHTGIDASKYPHKLTGKIAKGLSAPEAELCTGCHEKEKFKKKVTHAAVTMGCTGCHVPHSSANAKLLTARLPTVCQTCHDKKDFAGKSTHAPVEGGMCGACHDPHASEHAALLTKPTAALCLECHDEVKKRPHVVAGFSRSGHPVGDEKRPAMVEDPLRKGKAFSCTSCHEPHRSDTPRLTRLDPKSPTGFCQKCHPM